MTAIDSPPRVGDWIQTYTGRAFYPLDPRPEEICIEDISHALAHLCRYGGHSLRFYSVAEHCVLLSRAVPRHALWALLHDASEAYLCDLPRPTKRMLPGYAEMEARILSAIARRFGLTEEIPQEVKDADLRILSDERRQVMASPPQPWATDAEPLGVQVNCWPPERAECEFLARFVSIRSVKLSAGMGRPAS
jgi:hypothetical protein